MLCFGAIGAHIQNRCYLLRFLKVVWLSESHVSYLQNTNSKTVQYLCFLENSTFLVLMQCRTELSYLSPGLSGFTSWIPVLSGVLQGTALGPLYFTLYMDDIFDCFTDNCNTSSLLRRLQNYLTRLKTGVLIEHLISTIEVSHRISSWIL